MNEPKAKSLSPWGAIQSAETLAPGIVSVSTASHGGFWLAPARWAELLQTFPHFVGFAAAPWLEEDCDACIAALVWPDEFPVTFLRAAVQMYSRDGQYQPIVRNWLRFTAAGQALFARVRAWEKDNAQLWERGGSHGNSSGWIVDLHRVGDRARREVRMLDYPDQQFYSEEQLALVSVPKEPVIVTARALPVRFREEDCGGVFDGSRVWSETELGGAPGF